MTDIYLTISLSLSKSAVPNHFFHLRTPLANYFPKFTLHNSKMFAINIVAVISNLSCLTRLTYMPFPGLIQLYFRVPLNVLVHTPGCTSTLDWESLV